MNYTPESYRSPCLMEPASFDALIDERTGANHRYALNVARGLCGACHPDHKAKCHRENAGEDWLLEIQAADEKAPKGGEAA